MQVGALGQRRWIDLHDRADHHDRPIGPRRRERVDQLQVEPLVDHAVIAKPRAGQVALVRRAPVRLARDREVRRVNRRGEWVRVIVPPTLRLVQAAAAGKHDIGRFQQRRLALHQQRIGEGEGGELVHAVIDDRDRLQVPRPAEHHRRIEPGDRRGRQRVRHEFVEQRLQRFLLRIAVETRRQPGPERDDVVGGIRLVVEIRLATIGRERLLPEEQPSILREAPHEMLGSLGDEVPTEVREAE
jgi:hypothetical protein